MFDRKPTMTLKGVDYFEDPAIGSWEFTDPFTGQRQLAPNPAELDRAYFRLMQKARTATLQREDREARARGCAVQAALGQDLPGSLPAPRVTLRWS